MLWANRDDDMSVRKEPRMKAAMMAVLSGVMMLSVLGCETVQQKAETPTEAEAVGPVVAARELPPPKMQGRIFRVWPYGNGELQALLEERQEERRLESEKFT